MTLTKVQQQRYDRQIHLKEIGLKGQEKLGKGKVLIVGVGGLGSSAAFYLSAAGIGTIGLVDYDKVSLSNLNRQILHFSKDIGNSKTNSAKHKLSQLNADINILTYNKKLDEHLATSLFLEYDIIIDASDNFETKFLINDMCVKLQKPFVHAGASNFKGQIFTYTPGHTCYRCIFDKPPKGEIEKSILGVVPGILGTLQATEAIKYILDIGRLLEDAILEINLLDMQFRRIPVRRNPSCSVCGIGIN